MSKKGIKTIHKWYISGVKELLMAQGYTKKQARKMIKEYKLKKKLDAFPEIQMKMAVSDAAADIIKRCEEKESDFSNEQFQGFLQQIMQRVEKAAEISPENSEILELKAMIEQLIAKKN